MAVWLHGCVFLCLFVVCSFSVFACSFLFCLVGCLCVRVLFACLFVSLLKLAKAFQNACQNARKIAQTLIKIDGKTGKINKNGGLGVPGVIFGGFVAPGRHSKVGTRSLDALGLSRVTQKPTFGAKMSAQRAIWRASWVAKWVQNCHFCSKIDKKSPKSRSRRASTKSVEK